MWRRSVYVGVYNVAADIPHAQPVSWFLETLRERSIAARAKDVVVPPDLDYPERIADGAGQYAEMCSECHLAPGMKRTEIAGPLSSSSRTPPQERTHSGRAILGR